ncbi:hypothetical protein TrST_g9214 [Triparma strigata]|uniref:Uncharacterized protein n=1 Tax=Triparma strigata TaxID=1606541 RepID=A0A9W7EHY5_9STRA|nr:hypothetical protein TrST_g9214 [Triparma strigata]
MADFTSAASSTSQFPPTVSLLKSSLLSATRTSSSPPSSYFDWLNSAVSYYLPYSVASPKGSNEVYWFVLPLILSAVAGGRPIHAKNDDGRVMAKEEILLMVKDCISKLKRDGDTEDGYKYHLSFKVYSPDLPAQFGRRYLRCFDDSIPSSLIFALKACLQKYFLHHNYSTGWSDSPSTQYFSYLFPISSLTSTLQSTILGTFLSQTLSLSSLTRPDLATCTHIELWSHLRPPLSSHQFHFDTAHEGARGIHNPLCSSVTYLTDSGGPTIVTSQKITSKRPEKSAYVSKPKTGRTVIFDGQTFHGVIPGNEVVGDDRITLMCAFWPEASISAKSEEFTANMPFNTQNDPFGFTDSYACEIDEKNDAKEVEPLYCDELWCDSKPDMGKESCSRLRRIMDLEEVFII